MTNFHFLFLLFLILLKCKYIFPQMCLDEGLFHLKYFLLSLFYFKGEYCKGREDQCCEAECERVEGTYGLDEWWSCGYQLRKLSTQIPFKKLFNNK